MKSKYLVAFTLIVCLAMLAGAFVSEPAMNVAASAPPGDTTPTPAATTDVVPQPKVIQFAPGATSAILTGNLPAGGIDRYSIAAVAGQSAAASVTATAGKAIVVVWGADGTVLISDQAGATNWSGHLPTTQVYFLDVKAGPDAAAQYTLVVNLPPLVTGRTVDLSAVDANTTVDLTVGDMLAVMLQGDPTTGFTWEPQSVDGAVLQQLGEAQFRAASSAAGAGGMITLRFAAVAPGQTELQLAYQRPFETGVPPAKTFSVTIAVTPAPASPAVSCVDAAKFVIDVTIPDGTVLTPGMAFAKVWRVLNSGTCTWNANYRFVFVGGESMTPANTLPVPFTAPGATADLSIPMVAPDVPGPHVGRWELRSGKGAVFGPLMDVRINVGEVSQPAVTSTCSGTPSIAWFTASDTDISRHHSVTLSWGPVTNADRAEIVPGIGVVPTPGSIEIAVDETTTYSLNAYCGENLVTAQLTVYVHEEESQDLPSPPQAAILEPGNGFVGLAGQTIKVVFGGKGDARLERLELRVNDKTVKTVEASDATHDLEGTYDWHPSAGSYILRADVRDDSGQENLSPAVSGVIHAPSPSPISKPPKPVSLNGEWRAQLGSDTIRLDLKEGSCSQTSCSYGGSADFVVNKKSVSAKIEGGSFNGTTVKFDATPSAKGAHSSTFVGTLEAGNNSISGVWSEKGGPSGHVVFHKQ